MQQPSRYYIGALSNGVVNEVAFEFETPEGTELVVVPVPRYLDIQAIDLVGALKAQDAAYWFESYAALCGIDVAFPPLDLEGLCDAIAEADEAYNDEPPLPGLSTDWERF
jgi:hypothetical protein